MFNYFELLLVLLQIELRNTDFFNAISRHLKYRTTNMGSLPLFIAQAVFKEDRGHGNENEGLLITSLVLYFSWKKYLSGYHFSSTFQKGIAIKLGNLNVDFKELCLKIWNPVQPSVNTGQKCLLFCFLISKLQDKINRTLLKLIDIVLDLEVF